MMATVAIFGATGNIGRCLLSLVANEPAVEGVRIVTKRPELIESEANHAKEKGKTVVVKRGDYCADEAISIETLRGCSRLFVVLPQSLSSQEIVRGGKFVADCALVSKVESVVRISSLGIDRRSIQFVGSQGPLGDAHVVVEKYCAEVGLKQVSIRPTSLFSNINFNVEEIISKSTISTPLGNVARVNWISCDDVAKVAAKVLVAKNWDQFGEIIDVTGPRENTIGAKVMAQMISTSTKKLVEYKEVGIPLAPDYAGLWDFLRRDGYDCHCDNVERITGDPGKRFSELKIV